MKDVERRTLLITTTVFKGDNMTDDKTDWKKEIFGDKKVRFFSVFYKDNPKGERGNILFGTRPPPFIIINMKTGEENPLPLKFVCKLHRDKFNSDKELWNFVHKKSEKVLCEVCNE